MATHAVPADTDPAVHELLVARWRSMTLPERAALIDQLHADLEALAVAGIHAGRPELTGPGLRRELARRRYGAELADAAYSDLLG